MRCVHFDIATSNETSNLYVMVIDDNARLDLTKCNYHNAGSPTTAILITAHQQEKIDIATSDKIDNNENIPHNFAKHFWTMYHVSQSTHRGRGNLTWMSWSYIAQTTVVRTKLSTAIEAMLAVQLVASNNPPLLPDGAFTSFASGSHGSGSGPWPFQYAPR